MKQDLKNSDGDDKGAQEVTDTVSTGNATYLTKKNRRKILITK